MRYQVVLDKNKRQVIAQLPWQAETVIVTNPNRFRVYMRQGSNEFPDATNYDYLFPDESKSQESVDSNLYGLTLGEPGTLPVELTERTVVQFMRDEPPSSFGSMPIKAVNVGDVIIGELPPITIAPEQQVKLPTGQVVNVGDLPDVSLVDGQQVFLPAGTVVDVGLLPDVSIAPGQQIALPSGQIVNVGDLPDVSIAPGQQIALPSGQIVNVGTMPAVNIGTLPNVTIGNQPITLQAIADASANLLPATTFTLAAGTWTDFGTWDMQKYGGAVIVAQCPLGAPGALTVEVYQSDGDIFIRTFTATVPVGTTRYLYVPRILRYFALLRLYNPNAGTMTNARAFARASVQELVRDVSDPLSGVEPIIADQYYGRVNVTNRPTVLYPSNDALANLIPLTTIPGLPEGTGVYSSAQMDLLNYGGIFLAVFNPNDAELQVTIRTWDGIRGLATDYKQFYVSENANLALFFPRVERYMFVRFNNLITGKGAINNAQFHVRGITGEIEQLEGSDLGASQKIATHTFRGSHGSANTWTRSWTEALPSDTLPSGYEVIGYIVSASAPVAVELRLGGDSVGSDVFRLVVARIVDDGNTGWIAPSPGQYGGIVVDGSTNRLWFKTDVASIVVYVTLALRRISL